MLMMHVVCLKDDKTGDERPLNHVNNRLVNSVYICSREFEASAASVASCHIPGLYASKLARQRQLSAGGLSEEV